MKPTRRAISRASVSPSWMRRWRRRWRGWRNGAVSDAFKAALVERPESPGAYSNLGTIERKAGLIERAIQLAPGIAELHYNLGNLYFAARNLAAAARSYREAAALKPLFTPIYN